MHKKFVMRSRVEAREVTGKMAALQTELERLRELQTSTEEQLRGRRCATKTKIGQHAVGTVYTNVPIHLRLGAKIHARNDGKRVGGKINGDSR